MTKRMSSALLAAALLAAGCSISTTADARAYGGRSNGQSEHAGAGTSRSCLTSAARGILQQIESRFGAMKIISTCRAGATIAGSGRPSRHASGNAIDFDAGSKKSAVVRWLSANHHAGGTMTYPGMSHVHVDIGSHFVSLAGGRREASRSRSTREASNQTVRVARAWKSSRMSLGAKRRSDDSDD
jgi:Peptidase M15